MFSCIFSSVYVFSISFCWYFAEMVWFRAQTNLLLMKSFVYFNFISGAIAVYQSEDSFKKNERMGVMLKERMEVLVLLEFNS